MNHAVDAARALLPPWIGWSHGLFLPALTFVAVTAVAAGNRRMIRRALAAKHWTERARFAWAAGRYCSASLIFVPVPVVIFGYHWNGPLSRIPTSILLLLIVGAAVVAWLIAVYRQARRLKGAWLTPGYFLQGITAWTLLFMPHLVVTLVLALILPQSLDTAGLVGVALGAGLLAAAGLGAGLHVARGLGLARPAGPELAHAVEEEAARGGVSPRGAYEVRWPVATAFAFPWLGVVAVTDRALSTLDPAELAAVVRHELAHLTERRSVCVLRLLAVVALLPVACWRPIITAWGLAVFVGVAAATCVFLLSTRRIWRRMEVRADAAAQRDEDDAGTYARTLERLYEENLIPAVVAGAQVIHPNLYDRMLAAGTEPDFPRPAPPPRSARIIAFTAAIGVCAVLGLGLPVASSYLMSGGPEEAAVSLALFCGGAKDLEWLGYQESERNDPERALVFYRAAAALEPSSVWYASRVAVTLAGLGRLDEAAAALAEAEERARRSPPAAHEREFLHDVRRYLEETGATQR
jgi:Zn-dependent protease with chaperone function